MTRRIAALIALVLACPACRRHEASSSGGGPQNIPAGTVAMSDRNAARQLVSGFYGLEAGAWRWTAAKFSLQLGVPPSAPSSGAVLKLGLTIPGVVVQRLNEITLMAKLRDTQLPPQTFNKPGPYVYEQVVPAVAFQGSAPVRVDFWLDKAIPPSSADARQLGIIVNSFGLEARPVAN